MTDGDYATLARIEAKLDLLLARAGLDPRLSDLLPLIFGYWQTGAWTATEILEVACRPGRRDLLATLDAIVGDRGDPAKRLGRWLERHAGAEAGGYRLTRVKREAGSWLYAVESVE